jgi:hypothetical protein
MDRPSPQGGTGAGPGMGVAPEINPKGMKMIRNLKVLGIALAAVFAMSAVAASAASAQQGKLTSDGAFTLKTTETGAATANALTAFGLETQCPGSTIVGHKFTEPAVPNVLIPSGATATPTYVNCVTKVGASNFPTTVDMNGCDYVAKLGVTTPAGNKEGTYGVTFDIACTPPNEIVVTVFTNAADHLANKPMCKLDVKAQTGLTGAHVTYPAAGTDVNITGTVKGIHVQKTFTTHIALCPTATTAVAEFHIDVTAKGFDAAGNATNISISE